MLTIAFYTTHDITEILHEIACSMQCYADEGSVR